MESWVAARICLLKIKYPKLFIFLIFLFLSIMIIRTGLIIYSNISALFTFPTCHMMPGTGGSGGAPLPPKEFQFFPQHPEAPSGEEIPINQDQSLSRQTQRSLALQEAREREIIGVVREIYEQEFPPLDEKEYKYMAEDLRRGRTSDSSYSLKRLLDELRAKGHDSTLYRSMLRRYRKVYGPR
jgi:hypothetical protein